MRSLWWTSHLVAFLCPLLCPLPCFGGADVVRISTCALEDRNLQCRAIRVGRTRKDTWLTFTTSISARMGGHPLLSLLDSDGCELRELDELDDNSPHLVAMLARSHIPAGTAASSSSVGSDPGSPVIPGPAASQKTIPSPPHLPAPQGKRLLYFALKDGHSLSLYRNSDPGARPSCSPQSPTHWVWCGRCDRTSFLCDKTSE